MRCTLFVIIICFIVSIASDGLLLGHSRKACGPCKMVVTVPVADVRVKPEPIKNGATAPALSGDIGGQLTQVFLGDHVLGTNVPGKKKWIRVDVLGQKVFANKKTLTDKDALVPLTGFMQKSQLTQVSDFVQHTIVLRNLWTPLYKRPDVKSKILKHACMGTVLGAKKFNGNWLVAFIGKKKYYLTWPAGIGILHEFKQDCDISKKTDALRKNIIKTALQLVGTPYVLGGRSGAGNMTEQILGIDCSKFTSLAYLASAGLTIPCNSTSQKRACTLLGTGADLKPADLIFFHDDKCKSINHVALYMGRGMMLESAIPTKEVIYFAQDAKKYGVDLKDCCVKKVSVKERIGVDVKKIKNGKTRALDGRRIMLGTLLDSEEKIKKMRLLACGCDVSW